MRQYRGKLQMPCQKIISGGQTGVGRGALDAALELNFPCGGWCPKARLAEDGAIHRKYPLLEMQSVNYSDRTKKNIEASDGTLIIFHRSLSGGSKLTQEYVNLIKKPLMLIDLSKELSIHFTDDILKWVNRNKIRILNIAGPRESEWSQGYFEAKKIVKCLISNKSE